MTNNKLFDVKCSRSAIVPLYKTGAWIFSKLGTRGYGIFNRLMMPFSKGHTMEFNWQADTVFKFDASDQYWNRHCINATNNYEPELWAFFRKTKDLDYLFLDCGSNLGFWSILVSGEVLGPKPTIAIEGSVSTFEKLKENQKINNNRFIVKHNALYSEDNLELSFSTGKPTGRHLVTDSEDSGTPVTTISVDTLVKNSKTRQDLPVVVKLDVEGAEQAAVKGARDLLKRDVVFAYEDHGNDPAHTISVTLIEEYGLSVFKHIGRDKFKAIADLSELSESKINPRYGYNFFACMPGTLFYNKLIDSC